MALYTPLSRDQYDMFLSVFLLNTHCNKQMGGEHGTMSASRGANRIRQAIDEYRALPKEIYILFIARIINSAGWFVFPFLTLYMKHKLHMGEDAIGAYLLAVSISNAAGSLLGGKLADHMGRKKILLIFQTLSALLYGVCGFLGEDMLVPRVLLLASFCGNVAHPATTAMVIDLTTPENRQQSMSLLYLGMNIGVAIGPLVAGYLFEHNTHWLFWGDMITSLIATTLVLLFVRDTLPDKTLIQAIEASADRAHEKAESGGVFMALWRRPQLLVFCLLTVVTSFVYAQSSFTIPLHLTELFGEGNGAVYYGGNMTLNALVVVALTTPLMIGTRRIRPVMNVALASALYAIGFGMLFFEMGVWWFYISTVIWTLGEIISAVNVGVYVANHSPVTHRGRFDSVYNLIRGSGSAVAPWLTGMFIASTGVRWAWPLTFGLAVIAMIGFILLGNRENRSLRRVGMKTHR